MPYQPRPHLKRSKYRRLGLIGQGQFGQVFCAVHRQTGRLVALKNLEHERFSTHQFLRELRFLLSLQHPNIVTCHALEHTSTGRYLVMDYCEGGTLRNLMAEESRLSLPHSIKLIADVLAGLEHAHSRGIVHCDIKPENILVQVQAQGWSAHISDFGIARLSQEVIRSETAMGSPAYMAPEQFYSQYSVASDLYSVGILLFELLAGYRPFSGTPLELRAAHLNLPLQVPDSIPAIWQPLIARSLQKLTARRYRSAAEMRADLEAIAVKAKIAVEGRFLAANPLFFTVVQPMVGRLESVRVEPLDSPESSLEQPLSALAVLQPPVLTAENSRDFAELSFVLYQAAGCELRQITGPLFAGPEFAGSEFAGSEFAGSEFSAVDLSSPILIETHDAIQQLLVRPQGCFVIGHRSVQLIPALHTTPVLQPILQLNYPVQVAIEPEGRWLATLQTASEAKAAELALWPLSDRAWALASKPLSLAAVEPSPSGQLDTAHPTRQSHLLSVDARHLMILTRESARTTHILPQRGEEPTGTQLLVLTRRGNRLGTFHLPLQLQQVILTAQPYQLLAIDANHPSTVLLIDLQPYRVKRFWVEMEPSFLAATHWGYILATTCGHIVFLEQTGRIVGRIDISATITAITPVQHQGLVVATWQEKQAILHYLDLRLIGLDLVF